jgi:flagellar motor switch protein FliN
MDAQFETLNENGLTPEEKQPGISISASGMTSKDATASGNMAMLMGVSLQLAVELGRTQMTVSDILDLQKGSVIELDRIAGEAVDVFVNNSLIARGDVVVVDDKFGVRITELVPPEKRV